jgi:hypothetical protein
MREDELWSGVVVEVGQLILLFFEAVEVSPSHVVSRFYMGSRDSPEGVLPRRSKDKTVWSEIRRSDHLVAIESYLSSMIDVGLHFQEQSRITLCVIASPPTDLRKRSEKEPSQSFFPSSSRGAISSVNEVSRV